MQHLFDQLKRISLQFLYPIIQELPFFCMYILLMNHFMIRRIYGKIVMPQEYINTSYWSIFTSMCIVFLGAYIFSWVIVRCHKSWVRVFAYCVMVALFAIDLFLVERFSMAISPTMLMLLAETNQQESSEFVQTFMGWNDNKAVYSSILFAIILICILEIVYRAKVLSRLENTLLRKKALSVILAVCTLGVLSIGIGSLGTYYRMFQCEDSDALTMWSNESPCDPLSNTIYAFYGIQVSKEETRRAIEISLISDEAVQCEEDSIIVLFVIGESYIKQHAKLYGYELNTTPNLCREKELGNLYVFNDVCAPFNQTTLVMKNLLSCNSISDGESWSAAPFMPGVFAKGGFEVLYWDNQKDNSSVFEFTVNKYIYNEQFESIYTDTNAKPERYDQDLLDSFKARKASQKQVKQLVMFHLWGQHMNPEERYPNEARFIHFTEDSIRREDAHLTEEMKRTIANYDNATLYNDMIVNEIISLYKDKNAVMVYLADHGEEVYDYRDNLGRRSGGMDANILQYQYAVPFMIWCSPMYQERHPETMDAIKRAVDRPFMTDNTCQVLFHLAGIKSNYYHPERDLISDQYRKPKRLVNSTIDYDAIVHSGVN